MYEYVVEPALKFIRHYLLLSSIWKTAQLRYQLLGRQRDNVLQWPAMVLDLYNS